MEEGEESKLGTDDGKCKISWKTLTMIARKRAKEHDVNKNSHRTEVVKPQDLCYKSVLHRSAIQARIKHIYLFIILLPLH